MANDAEVMAFILGAGHTEVSIRPGPFNRERVPSPKLEGLILENAVRLRGWPVPYVDQRIPLLRHGNWIGQDIDAEVVPHCEAWRFFTSGQFLHRRVLATDMRSQSAQLRPDASGATGAVAVWDVLLYLVEVAELGARFATTLECETVSFVAALNGIAGRQLISGDWSRGLGRDLLITADSLRASSAVDAARLIQDPLGVGIALSQSLLGQFGLDIPDHVLIDWQGEVFNRG